LNIHVLHSKLSLPFPLHTHRRCLSCVYVFKDLREELAQSEQARLQEAAAHQTLEMKLRSELKSMESMHAKEMRKIQQTMETQVGIEVSNLKVKHEREMDRLRMEAERELRVTKSEALQSIQALQVAREREHKKG
jgi:hypothetical protein